MRDLCCRACNAYDLACADGHHACGVWAQQGECVLNTGFMLVTCCLSCRKIAAMNSTVKQRTACIDAHPSCGGWASLGECARNSEYMRQSCPASCQICSATN